MKWNSIGKEIWILAISLIFTLFCSCSESATKSEDELSENRESSSSFSSSEIEGSSQNSSEKMSSKKLSFSSLSEDVSSSSERSGGSSKKLGSSSSGKTQGSSSSLSSTALSFSQSSSGQSKPSSSSAAPLNHAPIFNVSYTVDATKGKIFTGFSIKENLPAASLVGTLTATDPDGDPISFSEIKLGPSIGDPVFAFDPSNGKFTTTTVIDAETSQIRPIFLIEVSDGKLMDTLTVILQLISLDKYPVKFPIKDAIRSIAAKAPVSQLVYTGVATDQDAHQYDLAWKMQYSITSGNTENTFAVNDAGAVTLAKIANLHFPSMIEVTANDGATTASYNLHIAITDSFVDSRDQKKYALVKIGEQTWMAQNLAYSANATKGVCYGKTDHAEYSNCSLDGRFYTWTEANASLCPTGWHLPTSQEWIQMRTYVDSVLNEYDTWINDKGKAYRSTDLWVGVWHQGGLNEFGFNLKPAGEGKSLNSTTVANLWTSTAKSADIASTFKMEIGLGFESDESNKTIDMHSVRCVQDVSP